MAVHKRINPFNQHTRSFGNIYISPEEEKDELDLHIPEEMPRWTTRQATPIEILEYGGKFSTAQIMTPKDLTAADAKRLLMNISKNELARLYGFKSIANLNYYLEKFGLQIRKQA
jgi:hypothetical protein